MKKPYLSIIIPTYNSACTLGDLLVSIFKSSYKNFEVIVVDDGSADNTKEVALKHNINYYKIKNQGPAYARHFGSKKAKGDVLVFFDSDVILFSDTLEKIKNYFSDKNKVAVSGIWDKKQKTESFFANYKALRDWCYWLIEDSDAHSYLFSTRVAAIRKKEYFMAGGFIANERGRNALEDIEFSYRLNSKYPVGFDPRIKVRHEFGSFWEGINKYFWRSYKWGKLFLRYKKLSRTVITTHEALAGILAAISMLCFLLGFFSPAFILFGIILFLTHLYFERVFLNFVYCEKGIVFAAKSAAMSLIIYPTIYMGTGASVLHQLFVLAQ